MKYCCLDFHGAIGSKEIIEGLYPSGKEYYIRKDNDNNEHRVYYCPFCGEDLKSR